MSMIEVLQNLMMNFAVIIVFCLVLYYRYPKIKSVLNKIFKLKSSKNVKDMKDKFNNEEMIDLIIGTINRIDDKHTAKKAIERIREIVGE